MVDKNIQLGIEDWSKVTYGNQYFGIKIEYGSFPAGEIADGKPFGEAISNNSIGAGLHWANGLVGVDGDAHYDPRTGNYSVNAGGNLRGFVGSVGVTLDKVGNVVSLDSLNAGLGGAVAKSGSVLGHQVGAEGTALLGLSYEKETGGFVGLKLDGSAGVGLGGATLNLHLGIPLTNSGASSGASATQGYRDFLAAEKLRKSIEEPLDKPRNQWDVPPVPASDRMQNPLAPTKGPVTPGGPPTTVQTPAGPKVVNPGSTYVPPGSAPAPKAVVPPSVTWQAMANHGGGGGTQPTAPVQPKLMPNPSLSNRDRQDGPTQPTSGGSAGGGSGGGRDPRPTYQGGSGSGSGSGGSGGGYVNTGNNPGNKNAAGYNGSSGGTKTNSSAGGWGDMAGAGYGKSTSTSSGSSGQKSSNSGSQNKGTSKNAKPIILDLGGDGFDVSFTGTARFDMDGDGFRERVGWAAAQDALLVLDLNADGSRGAGDGKIDQAKEVVLSLWGDAGMTDMEAVAKARDANGQLMFDTNGDGKLTAADAAWAEFRVWQDADQDGVTDAGELKTLDEMGFSEIGLTYDDGTSYAETSDDVIIQGAALLGAATRADFGIEWGCQFPDPIWKKTAGHAQREPGTRQIMPKVVMICLVPVCAAHCVTTPGRANN